MPIVLALDASPALRFTPADWAVLAGYFALLAVTGWLISRRQAPGADEYFVAKRNMPAWAVAFSVIATAISAATFIGAPFQSYAGDLTFLSAQLGQIIAIAIVAVFFIPAFYRHNVASVYQLVGRSFGPSAAKACAWTFMLGRVLANGARLFMAALAVSLVLFGNTADSNLIIAIAVMTLVAVLYTFTGGIRAVIFTDVIQTVVFVGAAAVAAVVILARIPAPLGDIARALADATTDTATPKLAVLSLSTDPAKTYTLFTALIGLTIFNVAAYGTDQDLAQRMLTCKSARKGSQSAVVAIAIGIPITLLFMLVGLLLFVFYRRPDLMGPHAASYQPNPEREVFLQFIMREMPPGLPGLMIAGLLAAALSTLTSSYNAMASAFLHDVYRPWKKRTSDAHDLRIGKLAMVGASLLIALFAIVCIFWQRSSETIAGTTLLDFALGVMTFAYAGLAAVFCCAIFTRRGNSTTAIAALAVGAAVVLLGQPALWRNISDQKVAFPWVLTAAFIAALITCLLGRRREGSPIA